MGEGAHYQLNYSNHPKPTVRWHLSSDSGHKLVGKCIVVGDYHDSPWRITHFNAALKNFTAVTMTVPSKAHYITLDDLRAGYSEGLIRVKETM